MSSGQSPAKETDKHTQSIVDNSSARIRQIKIFLIDFLGQRFKVNESNSSIF